MSGPRREKLPHFAIIIVVPVIPIIILAVVVTLTAAALPLVALPVALVMVRTPALVPAGRRGFGIVLLLAVVVLVYLGIINIVDCTAVLGGRVAILVARLQLLLAFYIYMLQWSRVQPTRWYSKLKFPSLAAC